MKPLRESALLLMAAGVLALLSLWLNPKRPTLSWTKPGVDEVDLRQVTTGSQAVLWIDARSTEAFRAQHIPGAISLNEGSWESQVPGFLAAWSPGTKVVVYCDTQACDASQAVAQRIQRELQLPDIYVLKGGWASWQQTHH